MKTFLIWTLAAVNAVLLLSLTQRGMFQSVAHAQVERPADYLLAPGEVTGGTNAVVYIIDSTNGRLGAMAYDPTTKRLEAMPPIDLHRVFQAAANNNR